MAIRHKRKNSAGYTWQAGDLVEGQIGLNIADGTLHFDKADGSTVTIAPGAITDIVQDTTPQLGGNLDVLTRSITTSTTNGNIILEPNGTGDVFLNADTVRVGDANAAATITTNGTGNLTLSTNAGTSSGTISIAQGANGSISILPNGTGTINFRGGTGDIDVGSRTISNGNDGGITINTGSGALILNNGGINTIASGSSTQNIRLRGNNLTGGFIEVSGATNGNIDITTSGTGDINLNADTVMIGDANAAATITTNGTGNLTLSTNNGAVSGTITINQGANADILITPNGSGDVDLVADTVQIGDVNSTATLTTNGTSNLVLNTNNGTNSGNITIFQGANNNIQISPNANGRIEMLTDVTIVGDANAQATITTNGTGNLVLNTNQGTNSGTIQINQGANTNINITPNGTGGTVVKNLEYNEFVHDLGTTSGTIAPNAANGNVQTITLNGNLTLNAFTSPVSGQTITFIITQDATGSRTLTSTMRFAGGSKTLTTAANSIDILTVSYIGTTYYASLAKGFV